MKKIIFLLLFITACGEIQEIPDIPLIDKQMAAVELIQASEGLRLKAYKCTGGRWSIGYGTKSRKGEVIKIEDASARMHDHLTRWVFPKMSETLSKGEYVAFSSYKYNTGRTIKDCREIITRKGGFTANGKFSGGLYKRRITEYSICKGISYQESEIEYKR